MEKTTIVAKAISYVLQPFTYGLLMIVMVTQIKEVDTASFWLASLAGIALMVAYVSIEVFIKKKHDYEFSDVKSRPALMAMTLIATLLPFAITSTFESTQSGAFLYRNISVIAFVSMVVSIKWKISIHAAFASAATVMLYSLDYNNTALLLLVLLPIVGWSRLYLQKHTFMQFLCGSILGLIMLWI